MQTPGATLTSPATCVIHADAVPPQSWTNGGGLVRVLLSWPSTGEWTVRISLAEIERDGPFSPFSGVSRLFAAVRGDGVALGFADRTLIVAPGDMPVYFDGGDAPACRLLSGPTQVFNLMTRAGTGLMQPIEAGVPWTCNGRQRGLYCTVGGLWRSGKETCETLAAGTLVWLTETDNGPFAFEPETLGPGPLGWWLACTPADA
jgi:environmental stress-induced protein Ves